uniref:Uncharacterized protein n=1 Tax=Salix viminalis TaxID=40686 RepID=A0A6N2M7S8_SALVM
MYIYIYTHTSTHTTNQWITDTDSIPDKQQPIKSNSVNNDNDQNNPSLLFSFSQSIITPLFNGTKRQVDLE